MYSFEEELWGVNVQLIAGCDEAGRGPLAGPVVAAAVILDSQKRRPEGLQDSKKLSEKRREALFPQIQEYADVGIGIVDVKIIDRINIYQASRLAMHRAIRNLPHEPQALLIDGVMHLPSKVTKLEIIKGDSLSASIAAASIIAKVTRDRIMTQMDESFPGYGFTKHKGYGTKIHLEALAKLGPSPIHRYSFAPVREAAIAQRQREKLITHDV